MLLGCWRLSESLHLQAGQLGGLLTVPTTPGYSGAPGF